MKEPIKIADNAALEKFVSVVSGTFGSSLGAIVSRSVDLSVISVYNCDATGVTDGFLKEILASGKEENTSCETGLLFKTTDITMLADLMLAGDGESSDTLSDDAKDAVKELISQLAGSLNVPVQEGLKKKFAIKIDDVEQNLSSDLYQASAYVAFDFKAVMGNKNFEFKFFMEKDLSSYLFNSSAQESETTGDNVNAPTAVQGNQNLDLLLDIDMPVSVRMGSAKLFLKDILGLGPGNIVELEQNADESIELVVNDKVIARGEVVIVDGYFGFRIKEIVSRAERIKKLKD